MKRGRFRPAVFVVVYKNNENKIEYLLLKRKLHWKGWEFPKGGIEFFETKKHAVLREVKEETNLKIIKIKKFNVKGKYVYNKKLKDRPNIIGQKYFLYSAKVMEGNVKIDEREHFNFKWMNFKEAKNKLTWINQKQCLLEVNNYLKNEKNN